MKPSDIRQVLNAAGAAPTPPSQNRCLWPPEYASDDPETLLKFVTECCWTNNEAESTVELIPNMPHVRAVIADWHSARAAGQSLIIEKSRRMLVSWLLRACELWSLGLKAEKGLIAGLDYAKAAEHVWRIWWLYHELQMHRPELNLPDPTPRDGNPAAQELGKVILANGSLVETLNQDGLSFQGAGFAWVTMEEFSRYRNCDYMYAQAVRVTEGKAKSKRGHVVVVTNASSGKAWQKLKSLAPETTIHDPQSSILAGINRGTCQNKARYLRIHYSADPAKDKAWADAERAAVPLREWQREMEMKEDVYDGEPVFADFRDAWHSHDPLPVCTKVGHYIGGWDCGQTITPAFCLLQITQRPWQMHALLEVVSPGAEPMEKFAPRVYNRLQKLLGSRADDVEHWGDTTVTTRNGANGETAQAAALRFGIHIRPSSNEWAGRFNAVTWLLTDNIAEHTPRFIVDPARCPVLYEGFKGAYRFETLNDGAVGPERMIDERPRKDGYSHVHDALQYAALRARWLLKWNRLKW